MPLAAPFASSPLQRVAERHRSVLQAASAYKRGRVAEFQDFDMLRTPGNSSKYNTNDAAWLLSTVGADDDSMYDDYATDDDYGPVVPDEWDTMEPKFVNRKQVLINMQIQ